MASTLRILTALLAVALIAAVAWVGWAAWQDHAYANELVRATHRVAAVNDREFGVAFRAAPSFYCEKRAGMPVEETLVRLMHATDAASIAAARRSASSFAAVNAPPRWRDFNDLVKARRRLDLDLTTSTGFANDRAIEVAASARPRTNLGVIQALIHDRSYRLRAAQADATASAMNELNSKLRHALPAHYVPAHAIKDELGRTVDRPTLRLGEMYMSITQPRPGSPARPDAPPHRASTTTDLAPSPGEPPYPTC